MLPISGVNTGAVQPLTPAEKALGTTAVQKPEEDQGRPRRPVMDEYIPEEKQEPSGRYWLGKDTDGQPAIYFDDPERAEDASDAEKPAEEPFPAGEPEKNGGAKGPKKKEEKDEICECSTDKADREIEKLKRKQKELEQRLSTETDEAKIKELERQLSQVKR